jgi:hypothetical protein
MSAATLPAVLLIDDLAHLLQTSVRTVRRGLQLGTFPIQPFTSPAAPNGLDRKYRWARVDVEQYLEAGYRSLDRRASRVRRIA